MSHKQAKRIRQQLKITQAYQQASDVVTYEKTNVKRNAFNDVKFKDKTYTTSTDITNVDTKRGMYRRAKAGK